MSHGAFVRKPLGVREESKRTLDQRLALRFPQLAALGNRLLLSLPPRSRIRQALLWRSARLAYEAFNRRDLEIVLLGYDAETQFLPPREAVEAGLLKSSYSGHDGFRAYFGEWLRAWGA
jgi:hypothetical protein